MDNYYFTALQDALGKIRFNEVALAAEFMRAAKIRGSVAWIIGNGGSAATASHFANDLRKMQSVRAVALPDLTPTVTAYGNDEGWENMFKNPLEKLMAKADVLVAISCSGKSKNILNAAAAVDPGILLVITGAPEDNPLADLPAAITVTVPHVDIRLQEDMHLAICHAIAGGI